MDRQSEDRGAVLNEYLGLTANIIRMTTGYDRYFEADNLMSLLAGRGVAATDVRALDYGCGVGDYGLTVIREGGSAEFYDVPKMIDFVAFRCRKDGLAGTVTHTVPAKVVTPEFNLVIFGEVLEHLESPLGVLRECVDAATRFLWTSSYPYVRDEAYFRRRGHTWSSYEQQGDCAALLETHYDAFRSDGESRLWEIKPA